MSSISSFSQSSFDHEQIDDEYDDDDEMWVLNENQSDATPFSFCLFRFDLSLSLPFCVDNWTVYESSTFMHPPRLQFSILSDVWFFFHIFLRFTLLASYDFDINIKI